MGTYEHEVGELQDLASRLSGLAEEFEGLDDRMEGYEGDLGHRDVAKALHDFADNWSDKREKLVKQMHELSGYVQIAADTYAGIENDLTGQFTTPPGPASPPQIGPVPAP